MTKNMILVATLSLMSTQAFASRILCVDRSFQDATITAQFISNGPSETVIIGLPVGETEMEYAKGSCVTEEDTLEVSLRCDDVVTESGEKYFARIHGKTAFISKGEEMIAKLPCEEAREK